VIYYNEFEPFAVAATFIKAVMEHLKDSE